MAKGEYRNFFLYTKAMSRATRYFRLKEAAQGLADDLNNSAGWQQYAVGTAVWCQGALAKTIPEGIKVNIPQLDT